MQDHVHKTHKPTRTFFTQSRTPRPSLIPNPESRTKKTVRTQSRPFPPAATSGIISTSSEESSGRSTTTPPASVSENRQCLFPCNQKLKKCSPSLEITSPKTERDMLVKQWREMEEQQKILKKENLKIQKNTLFNTNTTNTFQNQN